METLVVVPTPYKTTIHQQLSETLHIPSEPEVDTRLASKTLPTHLWKGAKIDIACYSNINKPPQSTLVINFELPALFLSQFDSLSTFFSITIFLLELHHCSSLLWSSFLSSTSHSNVLNWFDSASCSILSSYCILLLLCIHWK